jgi:subtilisin-like proprotein convertase family protein
MSGPARTSLRVVAAALAVAAALVTAGPAWADDTSFLVNPAPLTIPATGTSGAATPYPSPITASGLRGPITDVDVVLTGVGHEVPRDIRAVLVSPGGSRVALMDANCGINPAEDLNLTLDQDAATAMPSTVATPCTSTTYRPSAGTDNNPMPAPAPGPPYAISLNVLDGENPNGVWRLFVTDTRDGQVGDIEGGWTLVLHTGTAEVALPGGGTSGPADPFPLTTDLAGKTGVVSDVNASLGLTWHQRPDDLDLLLVSPQGQRSVLMSDACGETALASARLAWDDEAASLMPDAGPCTLGPFRPTDVDPGETFPSPAPPGPSSTGLSAFAGTDPNGAWRLYALDDSIGATGFASSLSVDVTTRPQAAVSFTQPAVGLAEGGTRTLTLRRTATGALGAGAVRVRTAPGSAASGSDFTPVDRTVAFAAGQSERTITVDARNDGAAEPAETYAVTLSGPTGDAALGTAARSTVTIAASSGPGGGPGPDPETPPPGARCAGETATITGTGHRDVLRGTRRRDVIVALGGADVVRAGGGRDLVCGGAGRDRISGGPGADRLLGGAGADRLSGGAGRDRLAGGPARDGCAGGPGRDRAGRCERKARIP